MSHSTRYHRFTIWGDAESYLRKFKVKDYFYDFKGIIKEFIWDILLSAHSDCVAILDTKEAKMYFCCYNCNYPKCYWRTDKGRLKAEGYRYIE